ncbi:hypothetical protein P9112_000590 [Eukaryota sp. TZLM1-RC]
MMTDPADPAGLTPYTNASWLPFNAHLFTYVVVQAAFYFLFIVSQSQFPWFIYPLLGWGIGIYCHFVCKVIFRTGYRALVCHTGTYIIVVAMLMITNYFTSPFPWALIPAAAWMIGVVAHWAAFFGPVGKKGFFVLFCLSVYFSLVSLSLFYLFQNVWLLTPLFFIVWMFGISILCMVGKRPSDPLEPFAVDADTYGTTTQETVVVQPAECVHDTFYPAVTPAVEGQLVYDYGHHPDRSVFVNEPF